ncbi:telomere regulation protein Stn1-domain-containing protein [Neurospora hispaniola]|uniref:Telomere regulation protein Stn1-domain-containing protein n=1 Tax=Neurospora hispaniola TaxID=588809 RepID=A0AAJ0I8Y9_9PEZI|nr:telomere regulation protein Stn1-domain-containing protein [Neurospora hispaniola]
MTDSGAQGQPPPELYPQYCFHLSPTINKWCHLRAADIIALSSHPGFQGQDLYFHLNHPIKWVRICGIVVAIDVYGDSSSRSKGQIQVITIDDSSGHTIECVVPLPPPSAPSVPSLGKQEQRQPPQSLPLIDSQIDIGHILDIKGSLRTFREQRQVKVEKIVHLCTTEQEVAFWERVVQLRKEILDKPWKLDEKVVRRLRREAMGVNERDAKREKEKDEARRERKRRRRLEEERRRLEKERRVEGERKVATPDPVVKTQALQVVVPTRTKRNVTGLERKIVSRPPIPTRPKEPTGLERKTKSVSSDRVVPVTGKYTALGL